MKKNPCILIINYGFFFFSYILFFFLFFSGLLNTLLSAPPPLPSHIVHYNCGGNLFGDSRNRIGSYLLLCTITGDTDTLMVPVNIAVIVIARRLHIVVWMVVFVVYAFKVLRG